MGTAGHLHGTFMASLEKRAAGFRIKFRYGGRQFSAALGVDKLREAEQV